MTKETTVAAPEDRGKEAQTTREESRTLVPPVDIFEVEVGLAVIVDLLNPQCIVLGSLYVRCERFLAPGMRETLAAEALPQSLRECRIVPALLGERVGDLAAVSVALYRRECERDVLG